MIDKVGAIILNNDKMLVARTAGSIWFFIPGGKREGNENDEECLRREIMEELGTEIEMLDFYREFTADATGNKGLVKVRAYFCKIKGIPKAQGEIEELAWIDSTFDRKRVGNVLKIIIPRLKEKDYIQ